MVIKPVDLGLHVQEIMTPKQRELIANAMQELEWMSCGGIGADGASQKELTEASNNGHPYDGDAVYHRSQQAWLYLKEALE